LAAAKRRAIVAAMSIRDWPEQERPRERLLEHGAGALSDAELLAIFLRTGSRGLSAVDLARDLLQRFGSLGALLSASQSDFTAAPGLGEAKYVQLQAVLELARRHYAAGLREPDALNHPELARRHVQAALSTRQREGMLCLFLNNRHALIKDELLFEGTIDQTTVHPREIVKRALALNAAAVILAHNHPSGNAEPSQADRAITARIREALALVDIRLLDHFVVGAGEPISLAERGWL
jgi:DNA repair protein RadC